MTAEEILTSKKRYAIIGASNDPEKYGYELVDVLHKSGYTVYPINPKYEFIDTIPCYHTIKELPLPPEVIIVALAPINSERVVNNLKIENGQTVWLPPNCFTDEAISICHRNNYSVVYDVCPIGTLRKMASQHSRKEG